MANCLKSAKMGENMGRVYFSCQRGPFVGYTILVLSPSIIFNELGIYYCTVTLTLPGLKKTLEMPNLKSPSLIPVARNRARQKVLGSSPDSLAGRLGWYLGRSHDHVT